MVAAVFVRYSPLLILFSLFSTSINIDTWNLIIDTDVTNITGITLKQRVLPLNVCNNRTTFYFWSFISSHLLYNTHDLHLCFIHVHMLRFQCIWPNAIPWHLPCRTFFSFLHFLHWQSDILLIGFHRCLWRQTIGSDICSDVFQMIHITHLIPCKNRK